MARYDIPKQIAPHQFHQLVHADREVFATFGNVDFQRTRFWCLAGAVAIDIPRRLGPDASPRELVIDKRISRRMYHGYSTLWRLFRNEYQVPAPPTWDDRHKINQDPLIARIGSTIIWEKQIHYLIDVVHRRMALLTEYEQMAIADRMTKWYSHQGMLLDWELEHLHRALKFIRETESPDYKIMLKTLREASNPQQYE